MIKSFLVTALLSFCALLSMKAYSHEIEASSAWSSPAIQGNSLLGIWGDKKGKLFTVGEMGTILVSGGKSWETIDAKTRLWLSDIWGDNSGNIIFVCGYNGTVLKLNKGNLTKYKTGITNDLNGIWGENSRSVYAVGDRGTIIHFNGNEWSRMDSGSKDLLFDIWGSSDTDIYAVGGRGTVLRWNGKKWSKVNHDFNSHITTIWGRGKDDIYLGADSGRLFHFDGSRWTTISLPIKSGIIRDIKGYDNNNNLAVLADPSVFLYLDGGIWSIQKIADEGTALRGMWIGSDGGITAVGDGGSIYYKKNPASGKWKNKNAGIFTDIHVIENLGSGKIYAGGSYGRILKLNKNSWTSIDTPFSATIRNIVKSIVGFTVQADDCNIYSFDSNMWKRYPDCGRKVYAVVNDSSDSLFIAGEDGYFAYLKGNRWIRVPLPLKKRIRDIYRSPSGAITLVGDSGAIYRFSKGKINSVPYITEENLYAVTGSLNSEDIYAAGDFGIILRYNGSVWTKMSSPAAYTIRAVKLLKKDILIAAGDHGGIYIYHDDKWLSVPPITGNTLRAIAAAAQDGNIIYISGDYGTIIRLSVSFKEEQ